MRVVALIGPGGNQVALLHKLRKEADLVGVVLSRNRPKAKPKRRLRLFVNRVEGRIVGYPFTRAWLEMLGRYEKQFGSLPDVPCVNVTNVNDPETTAFLTKLTPDLVVVSGTNLVGKKIIAWAKQRRGILNMHTGISPYVKGGPNCTNWCLATRQFHLIGSTTMWLDEGIDSGAIIATEQAPLTGCESLEEVHWKVMQHGHDMYVRTLRAIASGVEVHQIEQRCVVEGRTFYSAEWTARAMARAYANFRLHYRRSYFESAEFARATSSLKLFPLATTSHKTAVPTV